MRQAFQLAGILAMLMVHAASAGELIELRDGTSFVGDVREVTETNVTVDVEFPVPGLQKLAREQLSDRTLWRVLSARLAPDDAKGWMSLADWAEGRGLLVPALVGFRKAARDPGLSDTAAARIRSIEARLAERLYDRGERYYLADRPASARQYFRVLVARYPSTPVAPVAQMRLDWIERQIADANAAAKADATAAAADKLLRQDRRAWTSEVAIIREDLREAVRTASGHLEFSHPVRTSRRLEGAVRDLESAWKRVRNLGAPPDAEPPNATDQLAAEVKSRLVEAYLKTGRAYLMRPAIEQAEEFCTKACDLDPENAATHELHQRIIDAWLASGWWYGGARGRPSR